MAAISVVLVRPLAFALAGDRAATSAFFRATDLTPELLEDREALVTPGQRCVAWAEAKRLRGEDTLALTLADATPAGAFGIVEYLCRSCATVGDALAQWVRYLGILDDAVEVGLVEEGERTALRVLRDAEAPAPASHELCFALVARRAREMAGDRFRIAQVAFAHRIGDVSAYERFFDAPVIAGAAHTELVFPRDVLGVPLTTADPNLLDVLLPTAEHALAKPRGAPPFLDGVRRAVRRGMVEGNGQLDDVARRLGLSTRSLQRRLREEGTSFQAVRDETRQSLADRYLNEDLSMAEISFLLGFSAPSAFFRAFKRWTGSTPLEYRDALGA